jgi:hypothetical protein
VDSPLLHRRRLPNADEINAAILARYRQLGEDRILRRTHHFHGRFENTYVALEQIPELQPVVDLVLASAREILPDAGELRYGFWFNEMGPGHVTSLHDHDEEDELLSACYYIRVPERSGCFIAVEDGQQRFLQPEEGLLILFPPQLPHAVEENQSGETRLSVAFNIGPAEPEA